MAWTRNPKSRAISSRAHVARMSTCGLLESKQTCSISTHFRLNESLPSELVLETLRRSNPSFPFQHQIDSIEILSITISMKRPMVSMDGDPIDRYRERKGRRRGCDGWILSLWFRCRRRQPCCAADDNHDEKLRSRNIHLRNPILCFGTFLSYHTSRVLRRDSSLKHGQHTRFRRVQIRGSGNFHQHLFEVDESSFWSFFSRFGTEESEEDQTGRSSGRK